MSNRRRIKCFGARKSNNFIPDQIIVFYNYFTWCILIRTIRKLGKGVKRKFKPWSIFDPFRFITIRQFMHRKRLMIILIKAVEHKFSSILPVQILEVFQKRTLEYRFILIFMNIGKKENTIVNKKMVAFE